MPEENMAATVSRPAPPAEAELHDKPPAVVVDDDIEVWVEPESAVPVRRVPRTSRRLMLEAAAIAAVAVGIAVGIGLLISEIGDTDSVAGDGASVPEDCRPVAFSVEARPC